MANNAPFRQDKSSGDVQRFVFKHDGLNGKKHVPPEKCQDVWGSYSHNNVDNKKPLDNMITYVRSSSYIKNTSGRNRETNSTSATTAIAVAPTYKGEPYIRKNIISLNNYHEHSSARNGTYIPTQLYINNRTGHYVKDMNTLPVYDRAKEGNRTSSNLTHRVNILVNKSSTLFKEINTASGILKESVGMGNAKPSVYGNRKNIKNSIAVNTDCTNSSSTITNSTAANTSSRSSSKKTVKQYTQNGVLAPNDDVNSRNSMYSCTFPNNAYIHNAKDIHMISQNVNYCTQPKGPQVGKGGVGMTDLGNLRNDHSTKERHFVNAVKRSTGGGDVKMNNMYNVIQQAGGAAKEGKREYNYTTNNLTEISSGNNVESKRSATSNISTFVRSPQSTERGVITNRINKTDNINSFQHSQNLRKMIIWPNETIKSGSKQINPCVVQKNKEMTTNGPCVPSHMNTVKNERTHTITANRFASTSLQPPCAYAIPVEALKCVIPKKELLKKKGAETSTCNVNFHNSLSEPVFDEFRNEKSKTDDIQIGNKFRETKLAGGATGSFQSFTINDTSATINRCKTIAGKVQTQKEELINVIKSPPKKSTTGTEQQKKYANYINVDTKLAEENDLLYSCRNKTRGNTNIVLPNLVNYSKDEKVIPSSKHFIKHVKTEEKKERNGSELNSKVNHLRCAVPEETPVAKGAVSTHDEHKFTTSANIEPTQRKQKFIDTQIKEKPTFKGTNNQNQVSKNVLNHFTESILSKEEFKKILKDKNAVVPKKNTHGLLQDNAKLTTPTFNSSMDISPNVTSKDTLPLLKAMNLQDKSESSEKKKPLLGVGTFDVNSKHTLPKNISTKVMNYCNHVGGSLPSDNENTTRKDTSTNKIKEIDRTLKVQHTTNETSTQQSVTNNVSLNSKDHVADMSFEQDKTKTRNMSLRQLLTEQHPGMKSRPGEKDNRCVTEPINKNIPENKTIRKNEHHSNALCTLIKEKPLMAMEKEKRNASLKGGLYTTRFVEQSPQTETNCKSGYWTYRPSKECTLLTERRHNTSGHFGKKCIERTINSRMKAQTASIAENTCYAEKGSNGTVQSIMKNDLRKEMFRENCGNNYVHNRTLSSRSVCMRTTENGKALARCKTMKHVLSNNLNQSLPAKEISISEHQNNLTQLDISHANFFSHQPRSTHKMETKEDGTFFSQENWTLDTSTKLVDETPVIKKAVIIGCNYCRDKEHRLYGAANDAYVFSRTLVKYFDFSPSNIIFLSDCFPSDSYINEEFDLQKEEKEEREKLKESCERVPTHLVRKSREKKNLFSLFNKNDSKMENDANIHEPDSAKVISGNKKDVDLLSNVVHVNLWPTRTNILKAVNWLVRDSVARGTYVFFFAGKSIQVDNMSGWEGEGYDEAFLCSDPFIDNNEYNIITAVQLRDLLLSIHSKATMTIVLDCSGCQTILDPAGTENSWSYIKGCKQKGIWPITHPTNKVHKASYDISIFNNESMKKHFCRSRFANLIEVDSTSAMIDPLLQCISSPTIPPKAYCLCAATWEQISVEGFFPVFRFARVNQIKKMKIPDFQKKEKKDTNKKKSKQKVEQIENEKLPKNCNVSNQKKNRKKNKKSFYETKFDISVDMMKTFFRGSQNERSKTNEKKKDKWKKEGSSNKNDDNATEKENYHDEEEEIKEDSDMEEEGDDYYDDDDSTNEEEEEGDEEEESEIIVNHGVFTYCLIEAIVEFKEQELKKNILQNSHAECLPMTLKNLINLVQEKVQNVKNKKLKKLNQKPEVTLNPGSNANINNYFVHYSKNIHFQNGNYNFLGYDMTPYLNVVKAWEQINKNTLKHQKSLTLTTSLNKVARTISMSASNNVTTKAETPQHVNRVS